MGCCFFPGAFLPSAEDRDLIRLPRFLFPLYSPSRAFRLLADTQGTGTIVPSLDPPLGHRQFLNLRLNSAFCIRTSSDLGLIEQCNLRGEPLDRIKLEPVVFDRRRDFSNK
jgi:hypothetical protein